MNEAETIFLMLVCEQSGMGNSKDFPEGLPPQQLIFPRRGDGSIAMRLQRN